MQRYHRSLGLALSLAIAHIVLVVLPVTTESAITRVLTHLLDVSIILILDLINFLSFNIRRGGRQHLLQCLVLRFALQPAILRELHLDNQVEVTLGLPTLHRHTLAGNLEAVTWSQDLALRSLDVNATSIEVLEYCS